MKKLSVSLVLTLVMAILVANVASAAPGGTPAAHGVDGRTFGAAVSGLAQSAPAPWPTESEMIGRIQISQMAKLVRQDFAQLRRRVLAVKAVADGTITMVEFDDHEEPDEIGIVSVGRFRWIRRAAKDGTSRAES